MNISKKYKYVTFIYINTPYLYKYLKKYINTPRLYKYLKNYINTPNLYKYSTFLYYIKTGEAQI